MRKVLVIVITAMLLLPATAAADTFEPSPLTELSQTDEGMALINVTNNARSYIPKNACKKSKKSNKRRKCKRTSVGSEIYNTLTDEIQTATDTVNSLVSERSQERTAELEVWSQDRTRESQEPIDDLLNSALEGINGNADADIAALENSREERSLEAENSRNETVSQGVQGIINSRKNLCRKKYKSKKHAAKLKKCLKGAASRPVNKDDIEAEADEILQHETDIINKEIDNSVENVETWRNRELEDAGQSHDRAMAKAERTLESENMRGEKLLEKLERQDQRVADKLIKNGTSALKLIRP